MENKIIKANNPLKKYARFSISLLCVQEPGENYVPGSFVFFLSVRKSRLKNFKIEKGNQLFVRWNPFTDH